MTEEPSHSVAGDTAASENSMRGKGRRVFLGLAVVLFAIPLLAAATLHLTGYLPIQRWPKIFSRVLREHEPPETTSPKDYRRASFTIRYPRNWAIDTKHELHDPDGFLKINAPRHGQTQLQLLEVPIDCREALETIVARFDLPLVSIKQQTEFKAWGRLEGVGAAIEGEKLGKPFLVRIFAHTSKDRAVIVWEYHWDGKDGLNSPGFQLIEESFRFSSSEEGRP